MKALRPTLYPPARLSAIETVITKYGKGLEKAEHLDPEEACRNIREGAARAVRRMYEIPPFTAIKPPYEFEARFYEPLEDAVKNLEGIELVDERTYRIVTDDLFKLPM